MVNRQLDTLSTVEEKPEPPVRVDIGIGSRRAHRNSGELARYAVDKQGIKAKSPVPATEEL